MPLNQRLLLIIGAGMTLLYFICGIRKNKLKINHSIFWMVFGLVLLLLACMPSALFWVAASLGFQSPSNLVYIVVIFLLVLKLFTTTARLSKLNEQVVTLTQLLAIQQLEGEESRDSAERNKDFVDM